MAVAMHTRRPVRVTNDGFRRLGLVSYAPDSSRRRAKGDVSHVVSGKGAQGARAVVNGSGDLGRGA